MADSLDAGTLQKLKVPELRELCKERGVSSTGTKDKLVARLLEAGQGDAPLDEAASEQQAADALLEDDAEEGGEKVAAPAAAPSPAAAATAGANGTAANGASADTTKDSSAEGAVAAVTKVKAMTDEERLLARQQKFGAQSEAAKKASRAARFGLPTTSDKSSQKLSGGVVPADLEKLKTRAERFGGNVSSVTAKLSQQEALEKRRQRFGGSAQESVKTQQPVKRLSGGLSDEAEAKKKARAERFGAKK